jgi:hypothetical protein
MNEQVEAIVSDELIREKVRAALRSERDRWWIGRLLSAPLVAVLVAAPIGAWLQHRYDDMRLRTENQLIRERAAADRESSRQEAEMTTTMEVFENISQLLDRRLWHTRRLIWASERGATAEQLREHRIAYEEAVDDWNVNLNRNLALVERYFGEDARKDLEFGIAPAFQRIHSALATERKTPIPELKKQADAINQLLHPFNRKLLTATQERRTALSKAR